MGAIRAIAVRPVVLALRAQRKLHFFPERSPWQRKLKTNALLPGGVNRPASIAYRARFTTVGSTTISRECLISGLDVEMTVILAES